MRIALLSAGPSLTQTWPRASARGYDLRVGVNTAAELFEVDWWSVADADRFMEIPQIGKPSVLMIPNERDKVYASYEHRDRLRALHVVGWSEFWPKSGADPKWQNWSVIAALVFAKWKGAETIDVFGHDMKGEVDVTGRPSPHRKRNDERWGQEAEMWATVSKWVRDSGVTVEVVTNADRMLHPDQVEL